LRGLNQTFWHQIVTGKQVEDYISRAAGVDLGKVFDQYLRGTQIPVFEYELQGTTLRYRWTNVVAGFDMPIKAQISRGAMTLLRPTEEWKSATVDLGDLADFRVDRDYYVTVAG
jgi:hypothetical protein